MYGTKRLFDLIVSGLCILLFSIPLLFLVLLMLVKQGRPILYAQQRVGLHGKEFKMYKFRTMIPDAERNTGAIFVRTNDDRVTPLGKVLRKSKLDEFPQFYQIFLGQMSVIGPRPERPEIIPQILETTPNYNDRLICKPGWIACKYLVFENTIDAQLRLDTDMEYMRKASFGHDFVLLFQMVGRLIRYKA